MILDIIIILYVVINALIGFKKGFAKVLISFLALILAIVLAYTLRGTVANLISNNTNIDTKIEHTISSGIKNIINSDNKDLEDSKETFYYQILDKMGANENVDLFANKVARYIIEIISFIGIFIAVILISFVLQLISNFVFNIPGIKGINRILGLILATLISIIKVWIYLLILSVIAPLLPSVEEYIMNSTVIANFIYNTNIFLTIFSGKML